MQETLSGLGFVHADKYSYFVKRKTKERRFSTECVFKTVRADSYNRASVKQETTLPRHIPHFFPVYVSSLKDKVLGYQDRHP